MKKEECNKSPKKLSDLTLKQREELFRQLRISITHHSNVLADGNGRVGRLIMAFQAIQNNLIAPLILNDYRDNYLTALNNKEELCRFLEDGTIKSLELVKLLTLKFVE